MGIARFELPVRSKNLLRRLLEALVQLAPENLLNGAFGPRHSSSADAAEGAHLVHTHDLDLRITLRQLLTHQRILRCRTPIALNGLRKLNQPAHVALIDDLQSCAERAAFVHERADGGGPAFIHFADHVLHGHANVVKENFIELGLARHLFQRTHLHAGRLHVHQHHGDSLVLGHIGIGAHDEFAPIGGPAIAVPDFLSVDHIVIAIEPTFTTQVRKVGTGVRLGEALTPDLFRAQDFGKEALLLCFGAEGNDGRTDQPQPQHVGHGRRVGQSHLLPENHLLHQAGPASAIGFGPGNSCPAAFIELALPLLEIFEARLHLGFAKLVPIFGDVGMEPDAELIAETQFGSSQIQVH